MCARIIALHIYMTVWRQYPYFHLEKSFADQNQMIALLKSVANLPCSLSQIKAASGLCVASGAALLFMFLKEWDVASNLFKIFPVHFDKACNNPQGQS